MHLWVVEVYIIFWVCLVGLHYRFFLLKLTWLILVHVVACRFEDNDLGLIGRCTDMVCCFRLIVSLPHCFGESIWGWLFILYVLHLIRCTFHKSPSLRVSLTIANNKNKIYFPTFNYNRWHKSLLLYLPPKNGVIGFTIVIIKISSSHTWVSCSQTIYSSNRITFPKVSIPPNFKNIFSLFCFFSISKTLHFNLIRYEFTSSIMLIVF